MSYREKVRHPALTEPETASGELSVTPDGRLVRDQHLPRREISEIDDGFLSLRRKPEGQRNWLPVPVQMRPMFDILRHVVAGEADMIGDTFSPELLDQAALWRVRLVPRDTEASALGVVLIGCGAALRGIEISQPGGIVRSLTFGRP